MPKTKNAFGKQNFYNELLVRGLEDLPAVKDAVSIGDDFYLRGLREIFSELCLLSEPKENITDEKLEKAIDNLQNRNVPIYRHVRRLKRFIDAMTRHLLTTVDNDKRPTIDKMKRTRHLIDMYEKIIALTDFVTDLLKIFRSDRTRQYEVSLWRRVGARLKKARLNKKFSRKELALKLGMSEGGYSYYERGDREIPMFKLKRLTEILEVSADWLLGLKT